MSPDRAGSARHQVYADLVAGLIDARDDPASARFDAELDSAVTAGTITAATAHRLRFWQRASVRALADHARTVIPTALGALEASRREAQSAAEEMVATLGADPQVPEGPDVDVDVDHDGDHDGQDPAGRSVTDLRGLVGDTPGPASRATPVRTSTLGAHGNRLIVADLVSARSDHHS